MQAQYDVLRTKREADAPLTEDKQAQLIELSKRIEQFGADRLEAMVNLAQLRQISLTELMASLRIQTVSDQFVSKPLPSLEVVSANFKRQQAISQSQTMDELVAKTEPLELYD